MPDVIVQKAGGFGYGGKWVFNGEILPIRGLTNDHHLMRLGYFVWATESAHDPKAEVEHGERRFVGDSYRIAFLQQMEADAEARAPALPAQDELEYNAITGAGLIPTGDTRGAAQVSMATAEVSTSLVPECPLCGGEFSPQNIKRHVVACARKQIDPDEDPDEDDTDDD